MENADLEPSSLVEKFLAIAEKREKQAANAPTKVEAQELIAAAKSYRVLAEALSKTPVLPDQNRRRTE